MKCALAAVGFLNGNIGHNKKALADTLEKCAGKTDVVLFGEAFLQGFSGIRFEPEYDRTIALSRTDPVIGEIGAMAKKFSLTVSFGFIEKDGGTFFSSQMTIDPSGRIIDLYRRVSPGWKEAFAGKAYREGSGFHTFDFLGKKAAVGLCGDLWYEENISRLNDLNPDIVWWPVYTDYADSEWNNAAKFEYAQQVANIHAPVLYVNSVCLNPSGDHEMAKGGAAWFDQGFIKAELPAGNEGILFIEV